MFTLFFVLVSKIDYLIGPQQTKNVAAGTQIHLPRGANGHLATRRSFTMKVRMPEEEEEEGKVQCMYVTW